MYTENDIINYLNAWQTDGKHLDATVEDIFEFITDSSLYTDNDAKFFKGWRKDDFMDFARAIRNYRGYES